MSVVYGLACESGEEDDTAPDLTSAARRALIESAHVLGGRGAKRRLARLKRVELQAGTRSQKVPSTRSLTCRSPDGRAPVACGPEVTSSAP